MGKCKCKSKPRIISNIVKGIDGKCCQDICTNPICGEPEQLSLMAPVIYDEIGINLCTSFAAGTDIPTTYPTATSATVRAIGATFTDGAGGVTIAPIAGRTNCYTVTLTNITITFEVRLYDSSCRLVDTIFPTAVYLPSDTTAPTYDEDTNPSSVELEIFAPYGISYNTAVTPPTPALNYIGFSNTANTVTEGINLFSRARLLDIDIPNSTITVGLTLIIQSLYFTGYKVTNAGKIDVPKGCIISPENSDCMRFVAGKLLDLEIKPLDLGWPNNEQSLKRDCTTSCGDCSGGNCNQNSCCNENSNCNQNSGCSENCNSNEMNTDFGFMMDME